uniref:phosphatidate cytidylyltransferase n=1 Tax=Cyprinus carpio TaxID=7962 RepID=A0A8C2HT10_CYPCA
QGSGQGIPQASDGPTEDTVASQSNIWHLDTEPKSDSEAPEVPAPVDNTPEGLNQVLSGLSSRWRNCWVRGILTLAMSSGFFCSIYLGPMALITIVLCVQIKCFPEKRPG